MWNWQLIKEIKEKSWYEKIWLIEIFCILSEITSKNWIEFLFNISDSKIIVNNYKGNISFSFEYNITMWWSIEDQTEETLTTLFNLIND